MSSKAYFTAVIVVAAIVVFVASVFMYLVSDAVETDDERLWGNYLNDFNKNAKTRWLDERANTERIKRLR